MKKSGQALETKIQKIMSKVAIIGFTGTRNGMTEPQILAISEALLLIQDKYPACVGLHGGCIGADKDFDLICSNLGMETWCRPCTFAHFQARTGAKIIAQPTKPMLRNRAIVEQCHVLLACPPNDKPIPKSGTWATWKMAEKARKPRMVFFPGGQWKSLS